MISLMSIKDKVANGFAYIDKGKEKDLLLVPGWATDYRVFTHIDVEYNYLIAAKPMLYDFKENLLMALKENNIKKVSLFGWSLGGYQVSEFACEYPEFVDKLILVGIRDRYDPEQINQIKDYLKKNKRAYLYKFYASCFYNKDKLSWFKKSLFKQYCELFELDWLLTTLDYLAGATINRDKLKDLTLVNFVHGEYDRIAPIEEASLVQRKLTRSSFFTIKDAGHVPFLEHELPEKIW